MAVASALASFSGLAGAAGLGKINVLSGMGQPLRAELELSASREELTGMVARLASADTFKQAGVDYSSVLLDLKFTVDKRSDGKSVVRVSSSKPVNEPFLDFLVELNWPAGRLVREYTFLLDPPEVAVRSAARPVSVAEAKVIETPPAPVPTPAPAPAPEPIVSAKVVDKPVAKEVAKAETPAPAAKPAPTRPAPVASEAKADGRTVAVKAGDTLGRIAANNKPEGVSVEQMLVGLQRANPDAFFDGNINRLKSGAILNVPDKDAVAAVPDEEARSVLFAQARDWNAYRRKLAAATAAAPVRESESTQASTGKVTPRVDDKAAPAPVAKDQVKVSRAEQAAKGTKGVSDEDRVAMDKALKEANDRLQSLEKNINDMQKLLEMKNQKLAELERQVGQKAAPAPAPTPAPVAEKPVEKPAEAAPAKPEAAPAPAPEAKPAEGKPAEAPAEKPPAPPKPKIVLPPEEIEEPSILESLLADPLPLAGGGAILTLLAAYLLYRRRRPAADDGDGFITNTTLAVPETGMGAYQAPSGQSIDTSQTPPQSSEFSQAGPGTIDTDEVDPVAEAEVYMAYGRDAQAEEILLEALQKDAQRTAVHVKLLEIYAGRKSTKQFETLAEELYAQTGGHGPDWAKAAALGARLDPGNPLYRGEAAAAPEPAAAPVADVAPLVEPTEAPFDPEATMVVSRAPAADSPLPTLDMATPAAVPAAPAEPEADLPGLDFELNTPASEPKPAPAAAPVAAPAAAEDDNGLNFDLGDLTPPPAPSPAVEEVAEPIALDFDLPASAKAPVAEDLTVDVEETAKTEEAEALHIELPELPEVVEESIAPAVAEPVAETPAEADVALDFDLPAAVTAPEETPAAPAGEAEDLAFDIKLDDVSVSEEAPLPEAGFDLSSINLDLAAPSAAEEALPEPLSGSRAEAPAAAPVNEALREEVSTKLDLAKAYEEMGDLEGARELLAEVVAEGPPDLAGEAKDILARIGT